MDWPLTARAICLWRIRAAATSMNSRRAECKAPLPPGWHPIGLAFNSAGNLFEADDSSGNIYEFTPGGAQSTFASGLDGPRGHGLPARAAFASGRRLATCFKSPFTMPSPYYSTIIQASTNLVNWVNIYTNTPPFTFTNSMAETLPQCFYRAVLGH